MDPDRSSVRHREVPGEQRSRASPALTSFVVASRYMPVYIALLLLLVVASIWAPATLSSVALRAIAPYGAILGIAALGQMLVIMTGGIDLSVPAP
jgi:Ribose/xylose/arabinose/galactoside ABC-type transport systems, permease components